MSSLSSKGIGVSDFKKKYPRLYKKIMELYGGKSNVFDTYAAIELYLNNIPAPTCSVCASKLSITKKFRDSSTANLRCGKHVNTNLLITPAQLTAQAQKSNLSVDLTTMPEYITRSTIINIVCKDHGEYSQKVGYFLDGGGCQQCYHTLKGPRISKQEWISRSAITHKNFYNYSNSEYLSLSDTVEIECPTHGIFTQNAGVHMRGHGCKMCANDIVSTTLSLTTEDFINKSKLVHSSSNYDYTNVHYVNSHQPVDIICAKHGSFSQIAYYHLAGNGCTKCAHDKTTYKSAAEYEIIEFLKLNGITSIVHSDHHLGFELDIYLPDHKMAIEYNGIYWHSSDSKDTDNKKSTMHLHKTTVCEKNGITLLHILDLEWNNPVQKEIWKSTILHKLGLSKQKLYARKCNIVLVSHNTAKSFFEQNHLQGHAISALNIGLQHEDKLVAVGSFNKSRFSKKEEAYELIRFASLLGYSIVGGFQKIIKEFAKTHSGILISYANRRWSQGNVYNKSGFTLESISKPCYYYTDCKKTWHRSIFQKHKLKDKLSAYDENQTEVENMYNNNYRRIWDCGHMKFRIVL